MHKANRLIVGAALVLLIAAGAAGQFVIWPTTFTPDGLSYLERAEAMLEGDGWVSPYWSPLYPAVLAVVFAGAAPTPETEIAWVHFLGAVLFAVACLGLARMLAAYEALAPPSSALTSYARYAFVFAVWSEVAVRWNVLPWPSPDILVAALTFWIAAVALDADRDPSRRRPFILLGLLLGLGYLAKTAMAPLAAALLASLWLFRRRAWGAHAKNLSLAAAVFGLIFIGYAVFLSASLGRLTFGDSGRLNYAWEVRWDPQIKWYGWTGEVPGSGEPVHSPQVLFASPRTLSYRARFHEATVPMWYDPAYWNLGLRGPFRLDKQLETIRSETAKLVGFLKDQRITALAGVLCLLLAWRGALGGSARRWMGTWALAPLAMYCLVHMAYRYVYPFWVLLWVACALPEPRRPSRAKAHAIVLLAAAALLAAETGRRVVYDATHPVVVPREQVAEALRDLGVVDGTEVAVVGISGDVSFLRRVGARASFYIPEQERDQFEKASPGALRELIDVLEDQGVVALLSPSPPGGALGDAWTDLGERYCFALRLDDARQALSSATP